MIIGINAHEVNGKQYPSISSATEAIVLCEWHKIFERAEAIMNKSCFNCASKDR
jgi:hypothetical protein